MPDDSKCKMPGETIYWTRRRYQDNKTYTIYNLSCNYITVSRMNQLNNNLNKITHKISEEGAPIFEQLVEKLTGKGAVVTYSFDNLKIEMPKAQGPDGRQVGGGNLTVNGTIRISAEVHKKKNQSFEDTKGKEIPTKEDLQGYDSSNDVLR